LPDIHPTAVVDGDARIGANVTIGPYCIVGAEAELAEGVTLMSHVVVNGRTSIGANTKVFPFASIGLPPQAMKYKGEPSRLELGCNNIIREHVTMHTGTEGGGLVTRVGNNCLFMAGCHVAHDCRIGDHVIMVNSATLGGHVMVGDWAILGGLAAVHQFVRIGRYAMLGGLTGVESDVIPYGSVTGVRARLQGLNIIGLKRRGVSRDDIHVLRNAYRLLFAPEGTLAERLADVAKLFHGNAVVMEIVTFIRAESPRSICQPTLEDAA